MIFQKISTHPSCSVPYMCLVPFTLPGHTLSGLLRKTSPSFIIGQAVSPSAPYFLAKSALKVVCSTVIFTFFIFFTCFFAKLA